MTDGTVRGSRSGTIDPKSGPVLYGRRALMSRHGTILITVVRAEERPPNGPSSGYVRFVMGKRGVSSDPGAPNPNDLEPAGAPGSPLTPRFPITNRTFRGPPKIDRNRNVTFPGNRDSCNAKERGHFFKESGRNES